MHVFKACELYAGCMNVCISKLNSMKVICTFSKLLNYIKDICMFSKLLNNIKDVCTFSKLLDYTKVVKKKGLDVTA